MAHLLGLNVNQYAVCTDTGTERPRDSERKRALKYLSYRSLSYSDAKLTIPHGQHPNEVLLDLLQRAWSIKTQLSPK